MATQTEPLFKYHPDDWSGTAKYHDPVERTVHPVIAKLVEWATQTLPPDSSSKFLDDGCGRGTVTVEVKKSYPDASVVAVDNAAGMLEHFNERVKKYDWKNVAVKQLDGGDLTDISSDTITHAFACTYIDLASNDTAIVKELHRVIAPDGILAISTWVDPIHPSIATPWTKACQKVHPGYKAPFISNPKWSTTELLKENLEQAGFKDVQTKQIVTHWRWSSPEEMSGWFIHAGNPVCRRWHEALVEVAGEEALRDIKGALHEELEREYRQEGGQLLKDELVNLTIARK